MYRTFRDGNEIDLDATAIATATLSTDSDPASEHHLQALWSLAELVTASQVPGQVARSRSHVTNAQAQADIETSLRALLVDKIVQRRDEGWYLDLSVIAAGSSFSSWMRSTAERAVASERRNTARQVREQHPTGEFTGAELICHDTTGSEDDCDAAVTYFRSAAARTGDYQVHAAAAALSTGLGLSTPSRAALSAQARQRLAQTLAADELMAARTTRALLDGDVEHLDTELVELLDTLPDTDLAQWIEHDPRVAHTLVMSALAPTPKVKEATLRTLRSAVRSLPGCENAGVALARVVTTWATWRADVTGSKYGRGAGPAMKSEEQRDADTQAFREAVVALRRIPGAPRLGASLNAVADWLEDAHTQVEYALANELPVELSAPASAPARRAAGSAHLRAVS